MWPKLPRSWDLNFMSPVKVEYEHKKDRTKFMIHKRGEQVRYKVSRDDVNIEGDERKKLFKLFGLEE